MKSRRNSSPLYLSRSPQLQCADQWLDWFFDLRSKARTIGIWDNMDPYEPDGPDDELILPKARSFLKLKTRLIKEAQDNSKPDPLDADILRMYDILLRETESKLAIYHERAAKEEAIRNLIMDTVHPDIYEAAMNTLPGKHTLRQHVKSIQDIYAPTSLFLQSRVNVACRAVLDEAQAGNCDPEAWVHKWRKAFTRAEEFGSPYVQGREAVSDSLTAVDAHFAPGWGLSTYGDYIDSSDNEKVNMTLQTISQSFFYYINGIPARSKLDARCTENVAQAQVIKVDMSCPCGRRNHPWEAEECSILEVAIRGYKDGRTNSLSRKRRNDILRELWKNQWGDLRLRLEKKGWDIPKAVWPQVEKGPYWLEYPPLY
ncbi:hypothetical protein NCS52_00599600 [Fusarium sp. LHS14.1]|nr:hypothetical protein NCS52_00599600 [Fusarium sp. LHS14.1]